MAQDLKPWDPEDEHFWENHGKKVANRNLWISIPSLLCGFAIWLYWGIITVQMLNLGFLYEKSELFTLMAIAGLSGATLRISSTFFIRLAGGRNTIFLTTSLLIIPAVGTGFALQNMDTPLWVFQLLALLSGFGGGNFASSMSNISFFFPKKVQGYSLGMNAGLGNFGVTAMQILIPLVMTFGLFGGDSMTLLNGSGTLIGKIPAGTETFIHNAGFVWLFILVPLAFVTWFGMNNITEVHVSPKIGSTFGETIDPNKFTLTEPGLKNSNYIYIDPITNLKKNIIDNDLGLDFINDLKPRKFNKVNPAEYPDEIRKPNDENHGQWTDDQANKVWDGLIAQDVKEAIDAYIYRHLQQHRSSNKDLRMFMLYKHYQMGNGASGGYEKLTSS